VSGNPYRLWRRVRDLRLGSRSQKVYLLENPHDRKQRIVMKKYDASDRHHRGRYEKEVKVLRRLKGCPHTPQLLHAEDDTCSLWMTYCGRVAPMNEHTKKEVEHILKELAEKWGVHRVSDGGTVRRLDAASIFPKNITTINGKVFVIDYGSASYQLSPRTN
jgi:predicted Ser/Thr protein kinase